MDNRLKGVWAFVIMLFFLASLMSPMNATKLESKTENELIDVIVAYSNVETKLASDKSLSYTDLKYSEDDIKYFEGLIKQLMECYSKSTSDFTIEGESPKDTSGKVITSRIFYFGFTNAKMSDYNNRILNFTDLAGEFPIDRTIASSPNKVCTFAFLIFEDLSFSIVAFYNCNKDPLRQPFTASDYDEINANERIFNIELNDGKRTAISRNNDPNKKELAILASKIKIYLDQALERKDKKLDSACSDFLKDSSATQSADSVTTSDSSQSSDLGVSASCDPKTNPCCNEDFTLKGNGEPCDNPDSYWKCDTEFCSTSREKSACEDGKCNVQNNNLETKFAPEGYVCKTNEEGDDSFVEVDEQTYCSKVDTCSNEFESNEILTEYYGCDGYGNCGFLQDYEKQVCAGDSPNCCNGKCVNYQNDPLNCGGCDNSCEEGEICVNTKCTPRNEDNGCSSDDVPPCPEYCEDNVHYYNGVCNSDDVCNYESEEVDCCSTQNCIGQGDNFKCVGYRCICIPFDDAVLNIKCAGLECGSISNGCGGFFSCGECDDNDPCTTDSCNLDQNKCEYVSIPCEDGEICSQGQCIPIPSDEEGNSVMDDTQSEDLAEIEDEEQSSSQPSESIECKIDFGAITKTPPSFCREWGGNIFGSFLLKRYNWYKDINCPTKEYSYYSLIDEQSHLISYHCRDTCGGSSCGCDFGFGCEGCTENNGVILDCSKVQGSYCYADNENGEYVNQCNPQCVKAIDCRSGELKVITGIDNGEGYKELGCGYMPKGTSCVGENWMNGKCDGEGRCIIGGDFTEVPAIACSDEKLDKSGTGIYLKRNIEKPLEGIKVHYCFDFNAEQNTVDNIEFLLESAGAVHQFYSDCDDLASLKLIDSENPILDDGQSIIIYFGNDENVDIVFSETNYDSLNYQKEYSLAEKFYLYFLSSSSFTGVGDFVFKAKKLLENEENSYSKAKGGVSLLDSRANLYSVFDSVNSSDVCNIANTEGSTGPLKDYILSLHSEGNFVASKYIFGCLLDAASRKSYFVSGGRNLPLFVASDSPSSIDAYNNFFMDLDVTKSQNQFINNFYSSIQKLMHGDSQFHYQVDITPRNDNYVSKIFVKQTQNGGIITKEAPRVKINIASSNKISCDETYNKVTDILGVLFEKDAYTFPESIKPLGFSDSNNKEQNKKIIQLMHTSFFSTFPLDLTVAEVFADSLVEYSVLYDLNPYAVLALLHTEGMNPYSIRYEPHRDIFQYDQYFFNKEYPSKSEDFSMSLGMYDSFHETNPHKMNIISETWFKKIYPFTDYPLENINDYFIYDDSGNKLSIQSVVEINKELYDAPHLSNLYGKFTTSPDTNSGDPWIRDLVNYQNYASQIPALYYAYSSYGLSQIMPQTCVDAKKYLTSKQLNPANSNNYPLCECTKSKLLFTGENYDAITNQIACGLQAMYYKIESAKVSDNQVVPDTAGELGVAYKYGSLKENQVNSEGILLEEPSSYTTVSFDIIKSIDKRHYTGLGLANSPIQYATS